MNDFWVIDLVASYSQYITVCINAATFTGAAVVLEKQGRGKQYNPCILYPPRNIPAVRYLIHRYRTGVYFEGINVRSFHRLSMYRKHFITANLISHACMLQKLLFHDIKFAKAFLKVSANHIPSKRSLHGYIYLGCTPSPPPPPRSCTLYKVLNTLYFRYLKF